MSAIDAKKALELAELAEMTAEELERRATKLLEQCRALRREASDLTLVGSDPTPRGDAPRTVTRQGHIVDERVAIDAAKELGARFARGEFQAKLGLSPSETSKWLGILLRREHPVITRHLDGMYGYLEPPKTRTRRRREPPPEQLLVEPDVPRGAPVGQGQTARMMRGKKAQKAQLSRAGTGHRLRQSERRRQANQKNT